MADAAPARRTPGRRLVEPALVALIALAVYVAASCWAVLGHNLVMGDAISRLANASYAISGVDPHLAGIGFVWDPLPTLSEIPILALRPLWPALASPGLAASLASSVFMALTVGEVALLGRSWGLSRPWRLGVAALFGLNPLIVFYAANGMSEAWFLCFLIGAAGFLADWMVTRRMLGLVGAAAMLGLAGLVRYESLAAGAAAAAVVALVTVRECRREGRPAGWAAIARVAVLLLPLMLTFLGFVLAAWLVTGQPLLEFSNQYAVFSTGSEHLSGALLAHRALFSLAEVAGAAPLLLPLVAVLLLWGRPVARARALAVGSVFGGVLLLSVLLQLDGKTFPFLRYFIAAIPLQACLLLAVAGEIPALLTRTRAALARVGRRLWSPGLRPVRRVAAAGAVVGVVLVATGPTWTTMSSQVLGAQEFAVKAAALPSVRNREPAARTELRQFQTERDVAAYLDALHLPKGSVLLDVLQAFPVVLASNNPVQFVIPSDREYSAVVSDPWDHGVQYILVEPDSGRGQADAVNQRFPRLYRDGGGVGVLELQADASGPGPDWRLYRLLPKDLASPSQR